jgi:hypothetical protein
MSDFLAAQHLHYWRKPSARIILGLNYVLFPLLGLFGLIFYVFSKVTHPEQSWGAGFLPAISVLLLLPVFFQFNLRRSYKRSRVTDGECILEFTDDSIEAVMPGYAKSIFEWQAVRQFQENGKTLLVYVAPTRFFVIPKRVLIDAQRDELLGLLDRHMVRKTI